MNYLKLVETMNYALQISNANSRMQMRKIVIYELQCIIIEVRKKLGKYANSQSIRIIIDNLIYALDAVDKMQLKVLPETMKESITCKLEELKEEICVVAYKQLVITGEKFEVNNQSKKIVREVVQAAKRSGGLITC